MKAAELGLDRATWLLLIALALAWTIVSWRNAWVCDDAYITFRSVEQLHAGNGPRWNPHARVQAFTHPLWFGVLATARTVSAAPWWNAVALCFLFSTAALALAGRSVLGRPLSLLLLVATALSSKAFVDYSSAGLENALVFALLAVFLAQLRGLDDGRDDARGLLRLLLVGSLLLLCRHDLLLVVAPPLAAVAWRRRCLGPRKLAAIFLAGTAPFLAWTAFALFYYGFPFPNTAYAKLNTGVGEAQLWRQGLHYLQNAVSWDPVTAVVALAGPIVLLRSRRPAWIALGTGAILHLLYVVKVGGDFMAGRFLTPVFFLGLATLAAASRHWPRRALLGALVGLAMLQLTLPGSRLFVDAKRGFGSYLALDLTSWGISDEKSVWTGRGSFRGLERRLQARSWASKGAEARASGRAIVHTAVGWDGFHAGLETKIIDAYALADPLLARLPARRPWRIGHFARDVPEGYLDSLADGENRVLNPQIFRLYEHLRRVTEGPLLSWQRFKSIAHLNLRYRRPACAAPPCRNLRTQRLETLARGGAFAPAAGRIESVAVLTTRHDEKDAVRLTLSGWLPDVEAALVLVADGAIKVPKVRNVWRQDLVDETEGRIGPLAGFRIAADFADRESALAAARSACLLVRLEPGGRRSEWRLVRRHDGRCREQLRP